VERVNRDAVNPVLTQLVQTPFFRYFKVNLYCDCPFWPDDAMCSMRDCSVCECSDEEVPKPWKDAESGSKASTCAEGTSEPPAPTCPTQSTSSSEAWQIAQCRVDNHACGCPVQLSEMTRIMSYMAVKSCPILFILCPTWCVFFPILLSNYVLHGCQIEKETYLLVSEKKSAVLHCVRT
jgi:Endoplasmic Reticulum Oxidoreductin 1 (ERO1)